MSGRPRSNDERVAISFRLPAHLRDRLSEAALERDVSMNWLATRAFEEFLARLIPPDEIKWTADR